MQELILVPLRLQLRQAQLGFHLRGRILWKKVVSGV